MGTGGRKRLSLIQMILLTHLKAGFEEIGGPSVFLRVCKPSRKNIFFLLLFG